MRATCITNRVHTLLIDVFHDLKSGSCFKIMCQQSFGRGIKGVAMGGPGVPVTSPPFEPFFKKKPIIFRGENAMTIMFDTV